MTRRDLELEPIESYLDRELVRCGCGRVRNPDEDQSLVILAPLALQALPGVASVAALEHYETPRICRHCGVVYMLPKPSAPKERHAK